MNGGCEISVVDIRDCAELSEFDARFFKNQGLIGRMYYPTY